MLQSIMEMQKTQGQLVEAVQSLREGQRETSARLDTLSRDVSREVGSLSQRLGVTEQRVEALSRQLGSTDDKVEGLVNKVDALGHKVHTAQTVVWVVGAGLAGVVGIAGWTITNAIAVLPSLLTPK